MTCNVQGLRDDAACFYAMPQPLLQAAIAALWCQIAQNILPAEGQLEWDTDNNAPTWDTDSNSPIESFG